MTENKKTILVSDFVKEYSEITNAGQKKLYVKKHIIRKYCPLLEKLNILKIMNEKSVVNNDSGKYIDMTLSKLNTVMAILILYTDIRPDNSDGNQEAWKVYDLLKQTKLFNEILEYIGDDIEELMLVQKEVMDTWHIQNTSVQAFIRDIFDKAVEKFGTVAGVGMQDLSKILDDDVKLHKVMSHIENFINKNRK